MKAAAVASDSIPNSSSRPLLNPGPTAEPDRIRWNRRMPYMAQLSSTADSRADTGVGACE